MAKYAFDRLTFLDNSFLLMEGANSPMHVAGTAMYEVGPLRNAEDGIDIDKIRDYVNARLHLIPRYRQRLHRLLGGEGWTELQLRYGDMLDCLLPQRWQEHV